VKLDPSDTETWEGLVSSWLALGDTSKALDTVQHALEALPGNERLMKARIVALTVRARALIDQDQYVEALPVIDEALANPSDDSRRGSLFFFRAMALNALERFQEALDSIVEAGKLKAPQTGTFAFALIHVAALNGVQRSAEALEMLDQSFPGPLSENERAWLAFCRGIALNGLDRAQEALDTLSSADLSSLPPFAVPRLELERGQALLRLDRPAEALEAVAHGLPDAGTAHRVGLLTVRGAALNRMEKYPEALESFTEATQLLPPPEDAWYFWLQYGSALNANRRYAEAGEALERAVRTLESAGPNLRQQFGGALLILTIVRENLGKTDEALDALARAMTVLPPQMPFFEKKIALLTRAGKVEDAAETYEAIVRFDPAVEKNVNFWTARAGILAQLGRYDAIVSRVAPEIDSHPMTLAFRGSALIMAGRLLDGWPYLQRAAVIPAALEDQWLAWVGCAIAGVASARFEQASHALTRAAQLEPAITQNPNIALIEALTFQGLHENEKALASLSRMVENDQTRLIRGMVLSEAGRTDEALRDLELVARAPDSRLSARAVFAKALLLMRVRRATDAVQAFNEALAGEQWALERMLALAGKALAVSVPRLSETSGNASVAEATIDETLPLLNEAQSIAEKLPEGVPGRGFPLWVKAVLLSMTERDEEALLACRQAEQMEGPSPYILLTMGDSLLALEDYDHAWECFERAAQKSAGNSNAHVDALIGQGIALRKLERYEDSVTAYRAALALPPRQNRDEADVWMGLAESYAALHRFRAAGDHFRRAIACSSAPARLAARAGAVLLRHKRDDEALHFLQQAKAKGASDPEINFNIGVALYRLDKPAEARPAWQSAADAGLEKAQKVLRDFDKLTPRAGALLDQWFGEAVPWRRKAAGTVLLMIGFVCAALPLLKQNTIPWLNTGQPWTTTGLPVVVVLAILALPALTGLKAGPVELKLSPAETQLPLPRTTLDNLIERAIAAPATLAAVQGQTVGPSATRLDETYSVLAMHASMR
jgi:tetratricopeptide (TPR) repeat protein